MKKTRKMMAVLLAFLMPVIAVLPSFAVDSDAQAKTRENNNAYFPSAGFTVTGERILRRKSSNLFRLTESIRCIFPWDRLRFPTTAAANGAWTDDYLAKVSALLDTISPMIYDSNGPSDRGSLSDGVSQNGEEYVQLAENTCLWYARVFSENKIDCFQPSD